MLTIIDAIDDPNLFAPWFNRGATWTAWRAFLKALFALPLSAEEFQVYRECTGRTAPPAGPARECWLICGRRSGKSFMMALVGVFLAAFHDYGDYVVPGESAKVSIIAADKEQAQIILRYAKALLGVGRDPPSLLSNEVRKVVTRGVELTNGTLLEVAACSMRGTRGYTNVAILADEVAFWRAEESSEPDREVLNALRPAMVTIPTSVLLCASSPYARKGVLYEAFRDHYGRDADPVMVWRAPTLTMNPSVPKALVDEAYAADPASAAAEYGAEFRSDIESFIPRETLDRVTVRGRVELPPATGTRYIAFVDAAGGSGADSMTLAIAHTERDGAAVLDCICERRPPFSPDTVVAEVAAVLGSYGVLNVTGDRWGGAFPVERFKKHGITYTTSTKTKSDIYRDALPLLNSEKVELLDLLVIRNQFGALERKTGRGGRETIDHPLNGHDDVANAVAGALVLAAGKAARPVPLVGPVFIGGPDAAAAARGFFAPIGDGHGSGRGITLTTNLPLDSYRNRF